MSYNGEELQRRNKEQWTTRQLLQSHPSAVPRSTWTVTGATLQHTTVPCRTLVACLQLEIYRSISAMVVDP